MGTVIEVSDLSYQIGQQYLLKHINWTVRAGEHWAVFGMNGCGKTTLLSIIAGFRPYTEGSLKVFGESYSNQNIFELRKKIGWLSSSFFDKYYTKEAVLDIVLSAKSGTFGVRWDINEEDIINAKALLQEFQVLSKVNRPFNTLSKGERQNVLLARALFNKPKILILDEPSAGLDIYARAHLLETIRQLAENPELTIIYVTHYTEEIIPVIDKGIFLRNGCMYKQGNIEELMLSDVMSEFMEYPLEIKKNEDREFITKLSVRSKIKELQGMI